MDPESLAYDLQIAAEELGRLCQHALNARETPGVGDNLALSDLASLAWDIEQRIALSLEVFGDHAT